MLKQEEKEILRFNAPKNPENILTCVLFLVIGQL